MKKILTIIALSLGLLVTGAAAQHRDNGNHRGWEQQRERRYWHDRYERRGVYPDYSRIEVRNEYRYVRYGSVVYKEIYRTTYRVGRYGNEEILDRQLIRRERYDTYYDDRYGRNRSGIRFNVFLRF